MNELRGIYVLAAHPKIRITPDDADYRVRVDLNPTKISEELQHEIDNNWEGIVEKNPKATDGQILFVRDFKYDPDDGMHIETERKGFRHTAFFNRNPDNYPRVDELIEGTMVSISTHIHMLSSDGKLLFGTKKNQYNQRSGFGGFPQLEDYKQTDSGLMLNVYNTVQNRLRPEIGELTDAILDVNAVSVTYVDHMKLRGADMNFFVKVDETAANVQSKFEENSQFAKRLFPVENNPEAVAAFFKQTFDEDGAISPYCMGCQVAVQNAEYGSDAASLILNQIRDLGIKAEARLPTYWSLKELPK